MKAAIKPLAEPESPQMDTKVGVYRTQYDRIS